MLWDLLCLSILVAFHVLVLSLRGAIVFPVRYRAAWRYRVRAVLQIAEAKLFLVRVAWLVL